MKEEMNNDSSEGQIVEVECTGDSPPPFCGRTLDTISPL